jgi:hypothetical protein
LDILCQFVGFDGWYQFEQYQFGRKSISKQEMDIYSSCFDIDLVNDVAPHEGAFQSVSRKIALRFREDPSALLRNLPGLMKKKQFQVFFAEHFPDYDNLCSYYYQIYESYLKHKTTLEGQLFGNCMLFLKSFWQMNQEDCEKYILEINSIKIDETFHPYLIGRYFACNILYDSHFGDGNKLDKIHDRYLTMRASLPKSGKHFMDFPASEYIVSEALLQARRYEKCMEIVEFAFTESPLKMEFVRKGYYRQLQLFWLISNKKIEPEFDIHIELLKIRPENFYFISQKYFTVLYLYAKGSPNDILSAQKLAQELGNLYLQEILLNE